MKKYYIYILLLMMIIFIIPSLCTKKAVKTLSSSEFTEETNNTNEVSFETYDYSKYSEIKLYHSESGTIEILPIDEYLYGVVSAEMPANFELNALKAQAIVARTYTLYQIINGNSKHSDADICDNYTCCQAWISKEERLSKWSVNEAQANWSRICNAVDATQGKIITYNNIPIDAFFHSNSGGSTETATNVWGGTNFPYLQSVETAGEDGYTQYSSEVNISKEELINKIKEKHSEIQIDWNTEDCIKILEYTESGRVRTIKIGNINFAGTELRTLIGLKSTNFSFKIEGDNIIFSVIGYGHGVGMSQTGADSMAKSGNSPEEIIKHFYTGVEITYVNDL